MRVLIMATPSPSHFTPMVPLAWALRAAGHEVLVLGQPDIVEPAVAAGLPAAEIGDSYDATEVIASKLKPGKRPNQSGSAQVGPANPFLLAQPWLIHAKYMTKPYLEFARQWRPDLIVSDPLEFSASGLGGVLGVPVVHHRWDIEPLGDAPMHLARTVLGRRFAKFGLDGEIPDPALVLDCCPPSVRKGANETETRQRVQPLRYVPYNGVGTVPAWVAEPPKGRRVVVSLGGLTAALNGVPLFRSVIDGLEALPDIEVVVTLPARYREELGAVGPNTRVVDPTPLNLFLDTCTALVHHGGTGSSLTACAFGLPQIVLPQIGNEGVWAEGLVTAGVAASVVDPDAQDDPAEIRQAARAVLDDPDCAKRARAVADEIADLPSPADVVADLEALVG